MKIDKGVVYVPDRVLPALGEIAQLVLVANRPLISFALEAMSRVGAREIGVVAPSALQRELRAALGDGQRWSTRLTFIEPGPAEGPVDALLAAETFVNGASVIVHSGGMLLRSGLAAALRDFEDDEHDALVVLAPAGSAPETPVSIEEQRMHRLLSRPDGERSALTGAYILGSRFFGSAHQAVRSGSETRVSDALRTLSENGGSIGCHTADEWWGIDGSLDNLLDGNRRALERVFRSAGSPPADSRVEGPVIIDPSAVVETSTIRGPAVVGRNARIRSSYVGPYTSIGDDVTIHGAEIENSIVLPRARIEYVGRRIEASIVGSDAHIWRGFALPRALRLNVGDHAEVCLA